MKLKKDEPALYGLIGYPLEHSFSPEYFKDKFEREDIDATYQLLPVEDINEVKTLIADRPALKGLNVTIPYKVDVLSELDEVDDIATYVGAVNCIRVESGKLKGYNTDVFGFAESLQPLLKSYHSKALVLGNGGAAKAVKYVLNELKISYSIVSRNKTDGVIAYSDVDEKVVSEHLVIINTTPLGMHPDIDGCPVLPYEYLSDQHLLYDLIYNPAQTEFLKKGVQAGATIKNGQEMLELQAEASWRIWNS